MKTTHTANPPLRDPAPDLVGLVTAARGSAAKAIAAYDLNEKEVAELAANISRWGERQQRLEKTADPGDERTCAEIARLETQIRIGERRLRERQAVESKAMLDACGNAFMGMLRVVQPREYAAVLKGATDAVEPYCDCRITAENIAKGLPVVCHYEGALNLVSPYGADPIAVARAALAGLDRLAQGFWPWTPQ